MSNAAAESDGLPVPRRYWAAASIWLALAMAVLDSSIANIALPTIGHDLGASPAASIAVVNAYQIAITMTLLPMAALAERVGYARVYALGLALFVCASFGCVTAQNLPALAIARFVQGLGAGCVLGINGALVRFTYPLAFLGRGLGYNALVVAVSSAAGPSIAAAVLSVASWRWLFAVNLPIGVLALVIALRALPATRRITGRFDIASAALNALAFAGLFLAASDVAHGTASWRTALEAVVALAAAVWLVRRARGQVRPMLPLDLLRIPVLRLSYATSACSFAAQMMALVSLPFYFQARFGFDHVVTGLLITPMPLAIAVAAPTGGRLVERFSSGLLGGIGLAVLAIGLSVLALLPAHPSTALIVVAMIVSGFGFGLFQTPNNRTMLGLAPAHRSGAAAGMLATARLFGQTSGAVLVALLFRTTGPATNLALVSAAGLSAVAAMLSLSRIASRFHSEQ